MSTRDEIIRRRLLVLDEQEETVVTSWEADFIESVCYKNSGFSLSQRQVEVAERILEKYGV